MTEYIGELYPIALDVGITPTLFWEYSIQEITDIAKQIKARIEKEYNTKLNPAPIRHGRRWFHAVMSFSVETRTIENWNTAVLAAYVSSNAVREHINLC